MAEPEEVLSVLEILEAAYPAHKMRGFDAMSAKIYVRLLIDIPAQALEAAALQHIAEDEWFPAVAELRKTAFALMAAEYQELTPLEAWGKVSNAIRYSVMGDSGAYTYPRYHDLPDTVQRAVIALGGIRLLAMSEDPPGVLRAQFERAYNQLMDRQRTHARMLPEVRRAMQQLSKPANAGALPEPGEADEADEADEGLAPLGDLLAKMAADGRCEDAA